MPQPTGVPPIHVDHLPYATRLQARGLDAVDLVVVHCTELPDLATARAFGEQVRYPGSGTGNSGHWYIDRDGRIVEYVPPERVAHHVRGHNARSVGTELVNRGRWTGWPWPTRRWTSPTPTPRSRRCWRCSATCAPPCPRCATSPATRTSTPNGCRPATIPRYRWRASAIRGRCSRGLACSRAADCCAFPEPARRGAARIIAGGFPPRPAVP